MRPACRALTTSPAQPPCETPQSPPAQGRNPPGRRRPLGLLRNAAPPPSGSRGLHRRCRSHRRGPRTPSSPDRPGPVRLLCVENTHNNGGGTVWPLQDIKAVAAAGCEGALALHLDGVRLWHASVVSGVSEADYAAGFDTVSVCFSKALGAPVGSCLAGPADLIARARRFKQQIGRGFRQAGIVAADALHALEHHRERLDETHAHARQFAERIASLNGVDLDPSTVQTNIARFRLTNTKTAAFVEEMHRRGVHMLPSGEDAVRAVFHLEIGQAEMRRAIAAAKETDRTALNRPRRIAVTARRTAAGSVPFRDGPRAMRPSADDGFFGRSVRLRALVKRGRCRAPAFALPCPSRSVPLMAWTCWRQSSAKPRSASGGAGAASVGPEGSVGPPAATLRLHDVPQRTPTRKT
ncbi:beta-eliminating lyase-related protein [Streptomyces sp. NPDC007883]|uniref:threonine aldolase family protein n=1 Tax=Streptomyces sp. NPDC007883 TaxID=3155116 RepID=UPI00340B0418